ncbi:unnamed protein product [Ceratitis capitata]|uniref:(Mediterranean fruit fly) hypothetical protein n=1 Tax=Ceratitis capitata TaxID=7213 RepID=A0A811UIJ3_CERCA|nr:unnamed protein product [Ceratitis capitata]
MQMGDYAAYLYKYIIWFAKRKLVHPPSSSHSCRDTTNGSPPICHDNKILSSGSFNASHIHVSKDILGFMGYARRHKSTVNRRGEPADRSLAVGSSKDVLAVMMYIAIWQAGSSR